MESARCTRSDTTKERVATFWPFSIPILFLMLLLLLWKLGHPQRRKRALRRRCTSRPLKHSLASPQPIPFNRFILRQRFQMSILPLLEIPSRLLRFALAPRTRQLPNDGCRAADGIRFGLCLGFFLRAHLADLVQVAFEDGCVGDVFGGFGELEEDHACADLQKAHDYRGDFFAGAGEALEEHG